MSFTQEEWALRGHIPGTAVQRCDAEECQSSGLRRVTEAQRSDSFQVAPS